MKFIFTFVSLLLAVHTSFSQVLINDNAYFESANSTQWFLSNFTVDDSGNSYGAVHQQSQFNGSVWSGEGRAILFKYNKQGELQWVNAYGALASSGNSVSSFETDSENNILFTGYQSYDFLPESMIPAHTFFIAKMTPDGQFLFAKRFPGETNFKIRDNGNIVFTSFIESGGGFLGNEYFDDYHYLIVGEMNSEGTVLWRRMLNNQFDIASDMKVVRGMAVEDNRLYLFGEHWGTYSFDGHSGNLGYPINNVYDDYPNMYLASFNLTSRLFEDALHTTNFIIRDVAVNQDEVYLALDHYYSGSTQTPASIAGTAFPYPDHADAYIVKFNRDFDLLSSHNIGGSELTGYSSVNDLCFHDDKIYALGKYNLNWQTPSVMFENDYSITQNQIYISTYDLGLNYISSEHFNFVDNGFGGAYSYKRKIENNDDNLFICLENGRPGTTAPEDIGFIGVLDFAQDVGGIAENSKKTLAVFPNPVVGELLLHFEKAVSGELKISDIHGNVLISEKLLGIKNPVLDVRTLRAGMYFLEINGVLQQKFIVAN